MRKAEDTLEEMLLGLEKKVRLLISKNRAMRSENGELKSQIEFLLTENNQWQQKAAELTRSLSDARMSKTFSEVYGSKKEAMVAVDKMLQEIEDCIALINK